MFWYLHNCTFSWTLIAETPNMSLQYRCYAENCTNAYYSPVNNPKYVNKKFFKFPENDKERRLNWFSIMNLPPTDKRRYLCDEHFSEEQFCDTFRTRLLKFALPHPARKPAKKKCCVPGCNDKDSRRFRFPNRREMDRVDLWLRAINSPVLYNLSFDKIYTNCVVCERHFPKDQMLTNSGRRGIKANAVPCLNLPPRTHDARKKAMTEKPVEPPNLTKYVSRIIDSQEKSIADRPVELSMTATHISVKTELGSELQSNWDIGSNNKLIMHKVVNPNKSESNLYQSKCRVCLEGATKMYPIQGPIINCDLDLYKMISYCIGDEVDLSEDLPQNVCVACFKIIRICFNFINQYRSNQQILLTNRPKRIKFEHFNTAHHQEDIEAADPCDRDNIDLEFEQNQEETSNYSYENEDSLIENETAVNSSEEQMEIKFEHVEYVGDGDYDTEEQVEDVTVEENTEESLLLDLIKQDNVEIEADDDAVDMLNLAHENSNERKVIVSSVNVINPKNQQSSIGMDVQQELVPSSSGNTIEGDHNYIGVSESNPESKQSKNCNNSLPVYTKFIPILPKISPMKNIVITPIIPINSKLVTTKPLGTLPINSNIRLMPVKSSNFVLAAGTNQKPSPPQAIAGAKTIILKKRYGPVKTKARTITEAQKSSNFAKKKAVVKKVIKLKDESNDDETSEKADESSTQISNKVSRKITLRYPCPKCEDGVFLGRESTFKAHILGHHNGESFDCKKCSLTKLESHLFLEHFLTTHRFECPQCERTFKNKHNLVTHMRKHFNIRHPCTQDGCTKSFVTRFALRRHLEEHSGLVTYPCKICGHISSTYDTHNYHVRMHGGRKFLCTECGQTFLQASHLKAHMWKHTGKKNFKCDQCSNCYTSLGPLKKHKRKYHQ